MKAFVYWNITRKVWSVKSVKSGLVVRHADLLLLQNCRLKVSQAGRLRVIAEQRKNVHAGIQGEVIRWEDADDCTTALYNPIKVTYNPYKHLSFVHHMTLSTGEVVAVPVLDALLVRLSIVNNKPVVEAWTPQIQPAQHKTTQDSA